MASVNSPIRTLIKPLLYKTLPKSIYLYFQLYGKIRDIKGKLVEEKEMELLPDFIAPTDTILDIGANYAYYIERMAKLAPQGKLYAFEPIPFAYKVSKKIISHFKLKNVHLYPLAVANRNSDVTFRIPIAAFGGGSIGMAHFASRNNNLPRKEEFYACDKEEQIVCKQVRIDDYLLPKLKDKLNFIKIDIEGAEYYALEGMKETLKRFHPIILIEIQPFFLKGFGLTEDKITQLIHSFGYELFLYESSRKKLYLHNGSMIPANYLLLTKEHQQKFSYLISK